MMNNEFHTVRGYQLLDQNKVLLTSAMEDYLEMIYRNSLKEGYLRMNKLAELLNVRVSSATKMVQRLGELGLINYKKYGVVELSQGGREIGEYLLVRHKIVENFLKLLNCEKDILQQTELIEHNINPLTVKKISILNQFFELNSDIKKQYLEYLHKMD